MSSVFLCLWMSTFHVYRSVCESHAHISIIDMEKMNSFSFKSSFSNQKPVIINSQTTDWFANTDFFDVKNLYLNYGNESFQCGTSTDLSMTHRAAADTDDITLKLYLRKKKFNNYQIFDPYFIAQNVDKIGLKSLDLFHKIDTHLMNAYTFMLGKIGSGISFHTHGSVWFHQIVGKTKFFLYPPTYSPVGGALDWTVYTSEQWSKYILPHLTENIIDITSPKSKILRDIDMKQIVYDTNITSIHDLFDADTQPLFTPYKPIQCTLSEGQLLYIPRLWWYSTLNVQNDKNISIAMVMQTDNTPKEAGIERRYYNDAIRQFKTGFEYLYHYDDAMGAKQYFVKTLLVDPTFISSYVALADIYIREAAQQKKPKEYMETVIRFLKIAYLLNPEYDTVRESLMRILEHSGTDTDLLERIKQ